MGTHYPTTHPPTLAPARVPSFATDPVSPTPPAGCDLLRADLRCADLNTSPITQALVERVTTGWREYLARGGVQTLSRWVERYLSDYSDLAAAEYGAEVCDFIRTEMGRTHPRGAQATRASNEDAALRLKLGRVTMAVEAYLSSSCVSHGRALARLPADQEAAREQDWRNLNAAMDAFGKGLGDHARTMDKLIREARS